MAKLIFYDDTHTYTVDGEVFPSVSEISRFASREIYGEVSQYNLDNACSRGSEVHKTTEILDKYSKVECAEDIEPYIRAYIKFRKDFGITDYFAIEKALANENFKYAGTIDRIYQINEDFAQKVQENCKEFVRIDENGNVVKIKGGMEIQPFGLAIIDIKSSSVVQNVLALIQLNAYALSVEQNALGKVNALFILHLHKDGTYKLIGYEINRNLFMACLTLHNALQKKEKIEKGEYRK
jgi:hypothetical protein